MIFLTLNLRNSSTKFDKIKEKECFNLFKESFVCIPSFSFNKSPLLFSHDHCGWVGLVIFTK